VSWVAFSLAAIGFQTTRNGLARSLSGRVSPLLNSWARFAFTLPLAALLVAGLVLREGAPATSPRFWIACFGAAVSQLLANVALVSAFRLSNFAQSIVFHKLEVLVTAVVGVLLFAERPSAIGWAGMLLSTAGVIAMSLARGATGPLWRRALPVDAGSLLALAAALGIVIASFLAKDAVHAFRVANPEATGGLLEAVGHSVFHVSWIEVALLTAALAFRSPAEFRKVPAHWRRMFWIGACGFGASMAWFWAFSIGLVAYVRAVGQLESVVAVAIALRVFHEAEARRQIPGTALVVIGLALVLLG
jgi:drug/metabolite transporter (DMT)-like permease